jgi:DNA-binding IclR family transcriptional regulator
MAGREAAGGTLERGLRVLRLLIEVESDPAMKHHGLSVQQVALELGVHKSTASRLLRTLADNGFAVQPPGTRRGYRLGPALRSRFGLSPAQQRFRDLASPFLQELVGTTGECAHGAVVADGAALVVDAIETAQSLRVVLEKGRLLPLHTTSVGKCLLAWELAPVPADLPARTGRTITDPARLRAHLEHVREAGYAYDDEENHTGGCGITAPVFEGLGGEPIGCIGIGGPVQRVNEETVPHLAAEVVAAAARLTVAIGSAGGPPGHET